jgi:RNA polymerase sigma-70 factor
VRRIGFEITFPITVRDTSDFLVERVLADGRLAYPDVEVPPDGVRAYLEKRAPEIEALTAPRTEGLYLACACLNRHPAALRHLEILCRCELKKTFRRLHLEADEDEAMASLLPKLLIAEGDAQPKLGQYSGQSALAGWIQVIVARHLLYARRQQRSSKQLTDAILEEFVGSATPDCGPLDERARRSFKEALSKSLGALTCRDRNMLRHRLDGLNLAEIAELYRLSTSGVGRRLAKISIVVRHAVMAQLRQSLRLERPELDSLVRSVLGRMDSSLRLEVSCALPDPRE